MNQETLRERLYGCYVTIPTMFNDDDEMSVNLDGIRQHVEFLMMEASRPARASCWHAAPRATFRPCRSTSA